jgi:hypothetical protein
MRAYGRAATASEPSRRALDGIEERWLRTHAVSGDAKPRDARSTREGEVGRAHALRCLVDQRLSRPWPLARIAAELEVVLLRAR